MLRRAPCLTPHQRLHQLCLGGCKSLSYVDANTFCSLISSMGELAAAGSQAVAASSSSGSGNAAAGANNTNNNGNSTGAAQLASLYSNSQALVLPRSIITTCTDRAADLSKIQLGVVFRSLAQMFQLQLSSDQLLLAHFAKLYRSPRLVANSPCLASLAEFGRGLFYCKMPSSFQEFLQQQQQQQQQQEGTMNNSDASAQQQQQLTKNSPEAAISFLRSIHLTKTKELGPQITVELTSALASLPCHLVGMACTAVNSLTTTAPLVKEALLPSMVNRLSEIVLHQQQQQQQQQLLSDTDITKAFITLVDGNAPRTILQPLTEQLLARVQEFDCDNLCRLMHAFAADANKSKSHQQHRSVTSELYREDKLRPALARVAKIHQRLEGAHISLLLQSFSSLGLLHHPLARVLLRRLAQGDTLLHGLSVVDAAACLRVLSAMLQAEACSAALVMQAVSEIANFFAAVLCVDSLGNRVNVHRIILSLGGGDGDLEGGPAAQQQIDVFGALLQERGIIEGNMTATANKSKDSSDAEKKKNFAAAALPFHRIPCARSTLSACSVFLPPLAALLPAHASSADVGALLLVNAPALSTVELVRSLVACTRVSALLLTTANQNNSSSHSHSFSAFEITTSGGGTASSCLDFVPVWTFAVIALIGKIEAAAQRINGESSSSNKNSNTAVHARQQKLLLESAVAISLVARNLPVSNALIAELVGVVLSIVEPSLLKMNFSQLQPLLGALSGLRSVLLAQKTSTEQQDVATDTEKQQQQQQRISKGIDALDNINKKLLRAAQVADRAMPPRLAVTLGTAIADLTAPPLQQSPQEKQNDTAVAATAATSLVTLVLNISAAAVQQQQQQLTAPNDHSRIIMPTEMSEWSDVSSFLEDGLSILAHFVPIFAQHQTQLQAFASNNKSKLLDLLKLFDGAVLRASVQIERVVGMAVKIGSNALFEPPLATEENFYRPLANCLIKRADELSSRMMAALATKICTPTTATTTDEQSSSSSSSSIVARCVTAIFLRSLRASCSAAGEEEQHVPTAADIVRSDRSSAEIVQFCQQLVSGCAGRGEDARSKFPHAHAVLELVGLATPRPPPAAVQEQPQQQVPVLQQEQPLLQQQPPPQHTPQPQETQSLEAMCEAAEKKQQQQQQQFVDIQQKRDVPQQQQHHQQQAQQQRPSSSFNYTTPFEFDSSPVSEGVVSQFPAEMLAPKQTQQQPAQEESQRPQQEDRPSSSAEPAELPKMFRPTQQHQKLQPPRREEAGQHVTSVESPFATSSIVDLESMLRSQTHPNAVNLQPAQAQQQPVAAPSPAAMPKVAADVPLMSTRSAPTADVQEVVRQQQQQEQQPSLEQLLSMQSPQERPLPSPPPPPQQQHQQQQPQQQFTAADSFMTPHVAPRASAFPSQEQQQMPPQQIMRPQTTDAADTPPPPVQPQQQVVTHQGHECQQAQLQNSQQQQEEQQQQQQQPRPPRPPRGPRQPRPLRPVTSSIASDLDLGESIVLM